MNRGTIDIEGVIGWEVLARDIKRQLKDMDDVEEIDVFMNSPGGYIDDGFGTFTALKNHPATINMHITGMAASMGSVIAMAGDTVTIEPTGMMMIHPPASIAWGTAVEMRKEADVLDKYESRLITAYNRRDLNITDDELAKAVADETWYTAEEALEAGFVDSIADGVDEDVEPTNAAIEWLRVARYKNAPESVVNKIRTNRKKTTALANKLINNGGSAAETTGDEMSKYTQAELDAAVKAATEAATKEAKAQADKDAVDKAVNDTHDRYKQLMGHKNASNTKAVALVARSDMSIEEATEYMDEVAVAKKEDGKSNELTKEEIEKIGSAAAAKAVAKARAAASDTNDLENNPGNDLDDEDAEAVDKARADAANKRRGEK